jgi:hypothetical protein
MFSNVAMHNSNSRANGAPQHQRFHKYKRRVTALPAPALDFVSGAFPKHMIPKSGNRFSGKIMRKQNVRDA